MVSENVYFQIFVPVLSDKQNLFYFIYGCNIVKLNNKEKSFSNKYFYIMNSELVT